MLGLAFDGRIKIASLFIKPYSIAVEQECQTQGPQATGGPQQILLQPSQNNVM